MAGTGRAQRRVPTRPPPVVKEKYMSGPPLDISFEQKNLGERYLKCLQEQPEKIHQVDAQTGITETRGSVRERAIALAKAIAAKGIKSDERVVICSKCHFDMTVTLLACLINGLIVAPIDIYLTIEELQNLLILIAPKMAFCDLRTVSLVDRCLRKSQQSSPCILVLYGNEKKAEILHFNTLITSKPMTQQTASFTKKDMKYKSCFILPTQGTTGEIKLCECSEYSVMVRAKIWLDCFLCKSTKVLSYLPINVSEQIIFICASFEMNITRVLPGVFNARNCCKLVHDLQIDTALISTDFALQLIHHHSGAFDFNLSCLKSLYVGGVSLPTSKLKYVNRTFPSIELYNVYGLTEVGAISYSLISSPDSPLVQKLVPRIQIYVKNVKTNEHLGPNLTGELMVGGPQLMTGYFRNPHLNSSQFRRGFFRTGDLVSYDTDGNISLKGNLNEIIYIKDLNFSSLDLEDLILKCRAIKEVAIVGNKTEIVACIVKREDCDLTLNSLNGFLKNKISETWLPKRIEFFDHFPKTSMGKVKKYILIEKVFHYAYEESDLSSTDSNHNHTKK